MTEVRLPEARYGLRKSSKARYPTFVGAVTLARDGDGRPVEAIVSRASWRTHAGGKRTTAPVVSEPAVQGPVTVPAEQAVVAMMNMVPTGCTVVFFSPDAHEISWDESLVAEAQWRDPAAEVSVPVSAWDGPSIATVKWGRRRLHLYSTANWGASDWGTEEKLLGLAQTLPDESTQRHRNVLEWAIRLRNLLGERKLGSRMAQTVSAQALSHLRRHLVEGDEPVLDNDPAHLAIARKALAGGWIEGAGMETPGHAAVVDQRGSYGHVMANGKLPHAPIWANLGTDGGNGTCKMTVAELRELCEHEWVQVVATVRLGPHEPRLPIHCRNHRPDGQPLDKDEIAARCAQGHEVTATGMELARVIDCVTEVVTAEGWWSSEWMVPAATRLNEIRDACDDPFVTAIIKRLTLGLWGKMGQKPQKWVPCECDVIEDLVPDWCSPMGKAKMEQMFGHLPPHFSRPAGTRQIMACETAGDLVLHEMFPEGWRYAETGLTETATSMPAVGATILAKGRMNMLSLAEEIGMSSVYGVQTDALTVLVGPEGQLPPALESRMGPRVGDFSVKHDAPNGLIVLGHGWMDADTGERRLAGVRRDDPDPTLPHYWTREEVEMHDIPEGLSLPPP